MMRKAKINFPGKFHEIAKNEIFVSTEFITLDPRYCRCYCNNAELIMMTFDFHFCKFLLQLMAFFTCITCCPICSSDVWQTNNYDYILRDLQYRHEDYNMFSSGCVEKSPLETDHTSNFSILTAVNAEGNHALYCTHYRASASRQEYLKVILLASLNFEMGCLIYIINEPTSFTFLWIF